MVLSSLGVNRLNAQTNMAANISVAWRHPVSETPKDEQLPDDTRYQNNKLSDSLRLPRYNNQFNPQTNRLQRMKAIMLFTSGSIISAVGIGHGIKGNHNIIDKITPAGQEAKYDNRSYNRLALTGLVIIAGSIPCLINALKNKHKTGLKLTSQQTTFGYAHKRGKQITSLTYSIPFGHKSRY